MNFQTFYQEEHKTHFRVYFFQIISLFCFFINIYFQSKKKRSKFKGWSIVFVRVCVLSQNCALGEPILHHVTTAIVILAKLVAFWIRRFLPFLKKESKFDSSFICLRKSQIKLNGSKHRVKLCYSRLQCTIKRGLCYGRKY